MDKKKIKEKYKKKIKLISKLNKFYYEKNKPLVLDSEYDELKKEILILLFLFLDPKVNYSFSKVKELPWNVYIDKSLSMSYHSKPSSVALASGVAFLVSEFADYAIYTPLSKKNWLASVALSNTVGTFVDSALFLYLAFGSLDFITGQIVGKLWMTVLAIIVLIPVRNKIINKD